MGRVLSMSHHRETVTASGAPDAVGPYSHAVKAGLLFISGQIPLDPASGELVGDTPAEQARRCLGEPRRRSPRPAPRSRGTA